jgi:hypothetical protein
MRSKSVSADVCVCVHEYVAAVVYQRCAAVLIHMQLVVVLTLSRMMSCSRSRVVVEDVLLINITLRVPTAAGVLQC